MKKILVKMLVLTTAIMLAVAPTAMAEEPTHLFGTVNPAEKAKTTVTVEAARAERIWIDPATPDTMPITVDPIGPATPDTMPITVDPIGPATPDTQPIIVYPQTPDTQPAGVGMIVIGEGMTTSRAYVYDSMSGGRRIGSVPKSKEFNVLQIAGNRLLVGDETGVHGYVDIAKCNADLSAPYHFAFETTRAVNVFGTPKASSSSFIFALTKGSEVTLTGFRGTWALIRVGDEVGYTAYKYIEVKR